MAPLAGFWHSAARWSGPRAHASTSVAAPESAAGCAQRGDTVTREFWRLFTESRLPMLLLDDDRVFVAANDAGCLSLRRSPSEIVGRRMEQTTAPALRPKLSQLWRESRDTGHIAAPWQFVLSDGGTIDVDSILTRETPEPGRHLWLHWPRHRTADGRALSPRELEITNLIASGL